MNKLFYLSKTYWINFIVAALAFYPDISQWIAANPEAFGAVFAGINIIVRTLTKKEIRFLP